MLLTRLGTWGQEYQYSERQGRRRAQEGKVAYDTIAIMTEQL
jgi:hypothetical protein